MDKNVKETTPPNSEELAAMQAAQGEALAAQNKRIEQLMADLEAERASKGEIKVVIVKDGVPVKLGKKNYLVVHGLITEAGKLTVDQIAANKELCENLVQTGSSALKEV